jgi:cytochrome b6-f complex iron-sulfur subunit
VPSSAPPTSGMSIDQFGASRIDAGDIRALRASIAHRNAPRYVPVARAYVSAFPAELSDAVSGAYPSEVLPVLAEGVIVLYQRCPHLGCRVPFCQSSQWFECPCHGAKFDRVGEHRTGPSARGMDIFGAAIEQGRLVIDTTTVHPGLPVGTNSTHQRLQDPRACSPSADLT